MDAAFALACWERALTEELGIILTLESEDDKREIERVLYSSRQKAGNPDLECLMLARPGDDPKELWIVKKTTDMSDIK